MNIITHLAKKLKTPHDVQRFLRKFEYNREENGDTLRSALSALKSKKAHCLEAAFLAAAIMEIKGYPPLVLSLESKDGLDHVIYIFKSRGKWGSIARSRDDGLHGRAPVFRSLRDLAFSYFDPYIDRDGRITGYQEVNLNEMSGIKPEAWCTGKKPGWPIEKYLIDLKHRKLKSSDTRYRKVLKNYLVGKKAKRQKSWW